MRIFLTVFLMLCFSCGGSRLFAQENLVSFSEVIRRVVERDPGIKAQEAEREAARSEARRTRTLRLPKLYLSTNMGVGKGVNDVANVLLTGLSPASVTDPKTRANLLDLSADRPFMVPGARLESLLFDGGRTQAAIRSARLSEDKAEVSRGQTADEEAYATASDFLTLAQDRILDRYLEDHLRVAELAAKALSDQAKSGRITDAQALSGRAKFEATQAALENNRDDLRLVSDLLRERAGLPPQAAFDTRPLESFLEQSGLSALPAESDLENNAGFQTSVLDARIQEQRFPEFRFVAEYGFTFSSLVFTFRPGYNVAVRVNYPLFTSREVERNIRTELRKLDAATLREEKSRTLLHEDHARLLLENRKLGRQLDAARSELAQAQEVYRVTRLKYDQGAGSPSDLLEAAELLLSSRQRCLQLTKASLQLRWAAYRLQGKLLAELQSGVLP
jgi:outer membrane protein TolC